jgi:biotin carboxyl carrier protein
MSIELKIDTRIAKIEVLKQEGNQYHVKIDDREYTFDIEKVEQGGYSILYHGKSVNMEMIEGDAPNQYKVNTINNYYEIEVIDAATRYRNNSKSKFESEEGYISSPMPGKIVKVLIEKGDKVEKGQTVVIVSAMKMESEYKSPFDGVVKNIFVTEGQATEGNDPLVEIERT